MVKFEDISAQIAVLIKNNNEIETLCQNTFSKSISVIDNSVALKKYLPEMPSAEINKDKEDHFFNDEASSTRKSDIWMGNVVFFGNFEIDNAGDIPPIAVETVNGIITYKPSDIMRKIARLVGEDINKKISCSNNTKGVLAARYSVQSEVYYDRTSGTVGSFLDFELYKRNSAYN